MPAWLQHADEVARQALMLPRAAPLDLLAIGLAYVGDYPFWLVMGALAAWRFPARRPALVRLCLALLAAWLVNSDVLKPLFARPRPFDLVPGQVVLGPFPTGYSFPSGHAATALAGAIGLIAMWPEARLLSWVVAALVCWSRVYVGAHYPLDVVAGALVGIACARFALGGSACYIGESASVRPHVPR